MTWTILEIAAGHWAASGRLEPAAVLLGHLDSAGRLVADLAEDREQSRQAIGKLADEQTLREIGAGMSPDDVVEFVLSHLGG